MGFLSGGRLEEARATVRTMMASSRHRGPDDSGSVEIPLTDGTLVLGHTRLSIIDLSDGSQQPMQHTETNSWLVFNGEIYNFRQLRAELETLGIKFNTSGDTEVLLQALVQWGERALPKLEGMFAFAFCDGRSRNLLLARDRVGIKPLYYFSKDFSKSARPTEYTFAFASEVRVIEQSQLCPLNINQNAVDSFLAYGAVTGPNTIFSELHELEPGHLLRVDAQGEALEHEYWSLGRSVAEYEGAKVRDFDDAVKTVQKRLELAVESHLISDVPVGVFLSGGVDSSLLALIASRYAKSPITLLTVAFPEQEFSELPFASQIAQQIPHHHEVVTLTAKDLRDRLPVALNAMDQPTVDGINTFVISGVGARLGLKVLLTGIGGDELFGGYSTFRNAPTLFKYKAGLKPAAKMLGKLRTMLRSKSPIPWQKVAECGPLENLSDAYLLQRSIRWRQPHENDAVRRTLQNGLEGLSDDFQRVAALELNFYMRNQLLRDADVFSMANSVELRVPFLDTQLMETALTIPARFHFERGRGKRITRRILSDMAGPAIAQRRKMGFTFPWQNWLGRELKETIAETLRNRRLYDPLSLDPAYGKCLLDGLERGDRIQSWTEVWSLFVLLNWYGRVGVRYAAA